MAAVLALVAPVSVAPPRAEAVWSRWSGAWEAALDRQPGGTATCLWSTYDAPPPRHIRRLTFAANPRGEVVVIVSDRREPLHSAVPAGPSGVLDFGARLYVIEVGARIPLTGLPSDIVVGRVQGEEAAGFIREFGRHDGDRDVARLVLADDWSWHISLRGAAAAARGAGMRDSVPHDAID